MMNAREEIEGKIKDLIFFINTEFKKHKYETVTLENEIYTTVAQQILSLLSLEAHFKAKHDSRLSEAIEALEKIDSALDAERENGEKRKYCIRVNMARGRIKKLLAKLKER